MSICLAGRGNKSPKLGIEKVEAPCVLFIPAVGIDLDSEIAASKM